MKIEDICLHLSKINRLSQKKNADKKSRIENFTSSVTKKKLSAKFDSTSKNVNNKLPEI